MRVRALFVGMTLVLAGPALSQETFSAYRGKALKRDYAAQRNTAYCLRTGDCEGDYSPN